MVFRQLILITCCLLGSPLVRSQEMPVYVSGWQQVIPSTGLPDSVKPGRSNNNIDLAFWQGRYYMAFRTAPSHFASPYTRLYVMSTTDFRSWRCEREYSLGSDIREPRFAIFRDSLRLYFFQGGTNALKFEPQHIFTDAGQGAHKIDLDGYVPWRLRVFDSILYLSAYYGKDIYNDGHRADLRLFRSDDGFTFSPVTEFPQDTTMGAEEGEFLFDHNGNLWANIRLEGSGSLLCYADKDSIGNWHKHFSKHKYDSALMFEEGYDIYMIARRHIRGAATREMEPGPMRRKWNLFKYSLSRKTTSLFRLDKAAMRWERVLDFPSTGDTAFPAVAFDAQGILHILNYSNDIRKRDKVWLLGQLLPTYIYHASMSFP